jgi:beta-galactosidase
VSLGIRKRSSQDFPAAGLRWKVAYKKGENRLSAVAVKNGETVSDEIVQHYQSERWSEPSAIVLTKVSSDNDSVMIQAELQDVKKNICLDAAGYAVFSCAGDGELTADLGTSSGSSKVQMYNGRALIRVRTNGGESVVSVKYKGIPSAFLHV